MLVARRPRNVTLSRRVELGVSAWSDRSTIMFGT